MQKCPIRKFFIILPSSVAKILEQNRIMSKIFDPRVEYQTCSRLLTKHSGQVWETFGKVLFRLNEGVCWGIHLRSI